MSHPGGGYNEVKIDGYWYAEGSEEELEALAQQTIRCEAEREEARHTRTYSSAEYSAFVARTIEATCGAKIVGSFESQGYMYVKLDQAVNVDLAAGIIQRDTGLNVYKDDDPTYVILK